MTVKELLSRMQNEENFPAISQHITEFNSKASPTGDSSANELAALILRDYSLTSRLLKVSNSAVGMLWRCMKALEKAFELSNCAAA